MLLTIQAPTSAVPSTYNYYTSAGTVNIEDEALSLAINVDDSAVNYTIYIAEPEVNNEWSLGNCVLTNSVMFNIVGRVHGIGDESNPRFDINVKMNECLSDLKYLFGNNHTINNKCISARYARSERIYQDSNNRIQTADLNFYLMVTYTQSVRNPNLPAY
jgi:hypothetical protein